MNKKTTIKNTKKIKRRNTLNKTIKRSKKARTVKLWMRRFNLIIFCLAVVTCVCLSVYYCLAKIFVVKDISIKGETIYSDTDIKNLSGIKINDSLLFINCAKAEAKIFSELPYVEKVKINKQIPNKIDIFIQAAKPMYVLNIQEKYFVISECGKILETREEEFPELVKIDGVKILDVENKKVKYENPESEMLIAEIIQCFKSKGLNLIKKIDLSSTEDIKINYDNRINILLGSEEDADYKILTAKEIITSKIGAYEKGTLDLKNLKQENRSYFYEE